MSDVESAERGFAQALRAHLEARTGEPVEAVETDRSWVFLTRRLALKMRKPVQVGFLDFAAIAARRDVCEEELRSNRRFSRAIYRGVIAVRGSLRAPRIGGGGEPIDYLVCMRRLPAGASLSDRLAAGSLSGDCIEDVARCIADFHRRTTVARRSIPFGWPEQVMQAALDVMKRLDGADPRIVRLRSWVDEQAWLLWDVWLARHRKGFVRDCHGDLRSENVACVAGEVVPFGCLKVDAALRWTDVMSDVAFLAMDLDAGGRTDLAFRFIDAYLESTGDFDGIRVLRFQLVYRALLRAAASTGDACRPGVDYLDCALRWSAAGAPRLLITHGLCGSGESSVALQLLQRAGAIRLSADAERRRLSGPKPLDRAPESEAGPGATEVGRRVLERLFAGARAVLRAGFPAIVDAAFLRAEDRAVFQGLAQAEGVPFTILDGRGGDPLTADERRCALQVVAGAPVDVDALARRWRSRTLVAWSVDA